MSGRFEGKVAIVAGAARPPGMGFALARRLAAAGAVVACVDAVGEQPQDGYDTGIVSSDLLAEVAEEVGSIGPGAIGLAVDPNDPSSWERAVAQVIEQFGRVDLGCPFMGTTGTAAGDGQLLEVSAASWQRCYDVNVVAPLLFGRACAADMIRRDTGGSLCFLSSYSAVVPPAGNGAIASARAALNTVVQVLGLELGDRGIRVNAVQPLSVRSGDDRFPNPGLRRLQDNETGNVDSWVHLNLPLGRPQTPDETAAVAEFLLSDEASFVTGVSVPVAGGSHSHF